MQIAGCSSLFSEDLPEGQAFDELVVVNPFGTPLSEIEGCAQLASSFMTRKTCFYAWAGIAILLGFFFPACGSSPSGDQPDGANMEERVEQILSQMTLEEKIGQMAGNGSLSEVLAGYKSKPWPTPDNERLGIPGLRFTDGPRGVMLGRSTCFPVAMARGATWDPALERRVGRAMGLEARAQGANLYGSPCVNLLRHPGWGRAQETYGADPFHVGIMGAALVLGLQENVMACAKHFAANSIENTRFSVDVRMDDRTLREIYLPHFRRCVEAGVASVMSAYNRLNGAYCSQNGPLLNGILKGEWGFNGFVLSDFLLGVHSTEAVNAGLDLEMPIAIFFSQSAMLQAVQSGQVPMERIDDAVRRILRQKIRFGLLGDRAPVDPSVVACPEHRALALEAARKGIVLLKNEASTLPLDRRSLGRIALVGALAAEANLGDTGSSDVTPPYAVTPLAGISSKAGDSVTIDFYGGSDPDRIGSVAAQADAVIVVVGLTHRDEGEFIPVFGKSGGDREDLGLGEERDRVVAAAAAANRRCIVVLEGGSAIALGSWADQVPSILMAWYPGMEGGTALAEILFGEVNPSGKLPLTFPLSGGQLYPLGHDAQSIVYDLYPDYRFFDRQNLPPRFPFGHGLSYTNFSYRSLQLSTVALREDEPLAATVEISNIGDLPGEEIVQLYVGTLRSRVERPVRELKGFARVALEPSETRTVTIEVDPKSLAHYDHDAGSWEIEKTLYEVQVGASSRDIRLSSTFEIVDK